MTRLSVPFACASSFTLLLAAGCGESAPKDTEAADESAGESGAETGEPACGSPDLESVMLCVDPMRYENDLAFIAEPRSPGSNHWLAVQDYAQIELEAAGFTVERRSYSTGVNVIATRAGTTTPDEIVLVSAHYDSRGCPVSTIPGCPFDETECNAADDNATGVAAALEIARALGPMETERTVAIALWDEEEIDLNGSTAYVAELATTGEQIHLLINFDSIGFKSTEPNSQTIPDGFELVFPVEVAEVVDNEVRADFIVGAGDDSDVTTQALDVFESMGESTGLSVIQLVLIDGLAASPLADDLRRSDHAPFWDAAIPAVFITDSTEFRNDHYHCGAGQDAISDLDMTFATQVTQGALAATADAAVMR